MSLLDWVLKVGDQTYRVVADTEIDDVKIRTSWLGVATRFDREARPFIFETAVYEGTSLVRYTQHITEGDAISNHDEECTMVRAAHA